MAKKLKLIIIFIVSALSFSSTDALAEELLIAYSEWPPYIFIKDRKVEGILIDIVNEACKRLNIDPKFRFLPWKRALMYMRKGKADALLSPIYTEERAEFMYYPSEPVNMEKTVFLTWKGSGIKVNGLDDLKNKLIGVVRGYSHGSEFDNYPGLKKLPCNDDRQLVKILAKKRIDIAVGEAGVLQFIAKQTGTQVEVIHVLNETPGYITFSRKALGPKGKTLAEEFSRTLRQLKKEGVIEKIRNAYF
ncbi:transporter substrate-binding domain-containing protein [Desulfobacterales bacterium HSG2]|nr:transporter substrate-binding domain-containing protein [Desulfobacterales bacterium HSG2]